VTSKPQPARDKSHAQPDKGGREQYKRHVDGDITVRGQIETHLPPESAHKHDAEREQDAAAHRKNFVVGLLTLIAVTIYAGLTAWQAYLTRESINNNTKQFQIDQRPYLWTANTRPQTNIKVGEKMWANIHTADYGKSPAIDVKITGKIFIGPTARKDAYQWFDVLGDRVLNSPDDSVTVIPPGIPTPLTKDTIESTAFGAGGFFTIFSDNVLTQPDVDYITSNDATAVMVVHLQYFDGFGNRYWSNICVARLKNENVIQCPKHNDMH
jgi:hypothetical protein